jgi:hypothetical protein
MTRGRAPGPRAVIWARSGGPPSHECCGRSSRPEKGCSTEEYLEGFNERLSASIMTRQASQWASLEGGGSPEPDGQ